MLNPGDELQNRYKIERQVGAGGMGTVYIATDLRFGTKVAVKETHFTDSDMLRAFEREAQLLNGLRHPALPRVSDHFSEGDGQFIVMEYIAGQELSEMMAHGFAVSDVLRWADTLLDALDYLHTQRTPILHRDIKPQNLKMTSRGEVILLDFGLAKGSVSEQPHVSTVKSVFGYSLSYAPLEQIKGAGTDPRTDLYSLAATIYHLLTGRAPVDSITRATTILNGSDDPLQLAHDLNDKVPVTISRVLHKAMELNPNMRPATAALLRRELIEAAASGVTSAENSQPTIAGDKTVVDNDVQLKINAGAAVPANNELNSLKANTLNTRAAGNQHQTGAKINAQLTDYPTKIRSSVKPPGSQTAVRRAAMVAAKPSETGIFYHLQNSRAVQMGALLAVLLFGAAMTAAWYSMSPAAAGASSNPAVSQTNQNTEQKTSPDMLSANTANTQQQPAFTQTDTGNRVQTSATPVSYQQDAPLSLSGAENLLTQSPTVSQSQPQTVSSPQATPQIASVNNVPVRETKTEEPARSQPEVRPNNAGNQIDEERIKNEMRKQVDEAIREREEARRRQDDERRQQNPPYRQQPDGRPYPPPPLGQRPPFRRP